jgi:hypothetical protein
MNPKFVRSVWFDLSLKLRYKLRPDSLLKVLLSFLATEDHQVIGISKTTRVPHAWFASSFRSTISIVIFLFDLRFSAAMRSRVMMVARGL